MDRHEYKRQNEKRDAEREVRLAKEIEDVKGRRQLKWRPIWWNVPSDRFAFFVALFTGALVAVGYYQLTTLRNQADALIRADETTRESFTAIQRPFVTVTLDIRQDMPLYWEFQILGQNSGNTPTRALEYISIETNNPTDPEDAFIKPPDPIYQRWRGLIGPKDRIALVGTYMGRPFSVIQKLAEDHSQFFISGVAHYRGPFSRSPDYITKFCFAVIPIKQGAAVRPVYQPCLYWNCADDDCKADKAAYEAELAKVNSFPNTAK